MPSAFIRADASSAIGTGHVVRSCALASSLIRAGWTCRLAASAGSILLLPSDIPDGLEILPIPKERSHDPTWVAESEIEAFDIAIIDHYELDRAYEKRMRSWARHIVVIDDLANRPHDCDLLVDQNFGRRSDDYSAWVDPACQLLIGPEFSLLRDQFQDHRSESLSRRAQVSMPERIMVSFGGSDPQNASQMALEGLGLVGFEMTVDVIVGPVVRARAGE